MLKFLQKFFNSKNENVFELVEEFNSKAEEKSFGEENYFKIYHCELVD